MTVYVVMCESRYDSGSPWLSGVFSTEKEAEAYVTKAPYSHRRWIEKVEVDELVEGK